MHSVRQLPDRTPLRVKLITAVLALVAIALAVISIAGISVIKSYLLDQADSQLQNPLSGEAQSAVGHFLGGDSPGTAQGIAVNWIPAGGRLEQVVRPVAAGVGTRPGFGQAGQGPILPGPEVPAGVTRLSAHQGRIVTVPAQSGGRRWRVLLENATYQASPGSTTTGIVVVGVDVTTQYATIGRLVAIDLIVSLAVILGLAVVGIAVVRASLRPLITIEQTAGAIAAGDLTRRVPDRDPRTEVGRLGRSLNAMLTQIETAFRAQADSEFAARRSEERMRQFVADASHELRTPLTAIRGFAEYYRQRGGIRSAAHDEVAGQPAAPASAMTGDAAGTSTPPAPGHPGEFAGRNGSLARTDLDRIMRRVEQESARMGVLVEDMLLLARLDQQRPLEHRTVDLLAIAADSVHDARVVAPDRSINLTVGAGAALLVMGDEVRLRQVIGNLMSNALAHTPDGSPIDVRIRSGSPGEGRDPAPGGNGTAPPSAAVLEVADQGPGLTPEQAAHAFERFYRADQARTAGGTGLGLAIVAALVTAHNGAVWVESPPGGGAVFRIALPLAPEAIGHDTDSDSREGPDSDFLESHPGSGGLPAA